MSSHAGTGRPLRAVVVGAGIGGLASAVALRQAGLQVEVVERATALAEVGAALSLWPNALAALGCLGLEDAARAAGISEISGSLRRPSGRVMRRFDLSHRAAVAGEPAVVVHRAALQHLLLEAARGIPINLAKPSVGVSAGDGQVVVVMADGSSVPADLVVGADGLHSAVRASVLGDGPPRYTGLTTWRAVVEAGDLMTEASLSVGHGYQFIASSLPQDRVYWGAMAHLPEGANGAMREARSFLVDCFGGWHRPIPDLIEATPERDIVRTDVYDRPPPKRVMDGPVALVGDAAHPMTPDLGQGGCQALEDAVVLGACFQQHGKLAAALAAYQAHRLRRVRRIVRDSHLIGQIFGARGALVALPRDLLISGTPEMVSQRQLARYGSREAFLATLPDGAVRGDTMVAWSRTHGHNRRRWPMSGRA